MRYVVYLFISIGLFSTSNILVPYEYIYPIASLVYHNEKHFYLIHQTSSNHLDLLLWNPRTKEAHNVLLSRFIPAGLHIIPGGKGFSFIDNDTLRVKMYHKRSPQLIDFEEPLYNLTLVWWESETTLYFSACNNERFGIYQASLQGHCDCLVASDDYDCLYPQKINNFLFYIERDKKGLHKIVYIPYPNLSYDTIDPVHYISEQQRKTAAIKNKYDDIERHTVLDLGTKSIAFLNMVNEFEGFFLEHPSIIDTHDKRITFVYHRVYHTQHHEQWHDQVLFSFSIPAYYIMHKNTSHLYESILPLLPRYVSGHGLLFVDCHENDHGLSIWLYDMKQETVIPCVHAQENQSLFGILIDNRKAYYGGMLVHDELSLPRMWLGEDALYVDLPEFDLSDWCDV